MSRSQPVLTNPSKHFFRWSGSKGHLSYYDKELSEEVVVKLPFEFMPLDQLSTITGFCEQDKSSYWSNEVRSLRSELTVKTSMGTKEVGLYKDLTEARAHGAKYAKSIYCAYTDSETGEYVIGNLKAYGAALTAWIEFCRNKVVENGKVILTGSTEDKKGTNKYYVPVFEYQSCEPLEQETAIKLDKELQVYLSVYLNAKEEPSNDDVVIEDIPDGQHEVDALVGKAAQQHREAVQLDQDKIDLNEIPF